MTPSTDVEAMNVDRSMSDRPVIWPVVDVASSTSDREWKVHAHPHSTPEHHYRGESNCDEACRRGLRLHRHRLPTAPPTLKDLFREQRTGSVPLAFAPREYVRHVDRSMYVASGDEEQ